MSWHQYSQQLGLVHCNSCAIPSLTHIHGEVDTHVDVLCPHVVGGVSVEHREDAAVQVSLASCLSVTAHGDDGGTGPVPGDQVGGPAHVHRYIFANYFLQHRYTSNHWLLQDLATNSVPEVMFMSSVDKFYLVLVSRVRKRFSYYGSMFNTLLENF